LKGGDLIAIRAVPSGHCGSFKLFKNIIAYICCL
jgi:hypothetical protein